MRRMPIQSPLNGPHSRIASIMYWEQEGVYRHEGGKSGEMAIW